MVDLLGTYSLTAYSLDERIARDFLIRETPDAVVAVIDASNLERDLYLVVLLLELGTNVILDLNMMDLVENGGIKIDTEKLSLVLGISAVETVANKGKGMDDLKRAIGETGAHEKTTAFMVMSLIYIPCIAAIATIKRETNWKWTGLAVGYSLILGWTVAVLIYQVGKLFQ